MAVPFRLLSIGLFSLVCLVGCASTPAPGVYHVVQEGQTLYRIALTYEVDAKALARANHLKDPARLRAGSRIFIPGAKSPLPVPSTVTPTRSADPPPASGAIGDRPPQTGRETKKKTDSPSAAVPAPVPDRKRFIWPVRGEIVKPFGEVKDTKCQGVEIGVPLNSPVKSAAAGKVIYSGNGIPGFGNLIIIEHSESFFTVYGFNAKNLVKIGAYVGQGEKIALSGAPPSGGKPRIHFEIRQGKKPVDPFFFLP